MPFCMAERAALEALEMRPYGRGSLHLLSQGPTTLPWATAEEDVRIAVAAAGARAAFMSRTRRGHATTLQDAVIGPVGGVVYTLGHSDAPHLPPQAALCRDAASGSLCPVAGSTCRELVPVMDAAARRLFAVVFWGIVYRLAQIRS